MISSSGAARALAVAACAVSAALACSNTPSRPETGVTMQYPANDPPFVYVPPESQGADVEVPVTPDIDASDADASEADVDAPSDAPVEGDVMGDAPSDAVDEIAQE